MGQASGSLAAGEHDQHAVTPPLSLRARPPQFANLDQDKQESIYREARAALEPWANKTVFVRNYTTRAAELVPDGLDFVYVDARHDFCGVSLPKVLHL